MAVPRSRVLDLMKVRLPQYPSHSRQHRLTTSITPQVQCRIFNTTFNPTNERTGNKVLRQRLKGPSFSAYYPRRVVTFKDLQRVYPQWEMYDEKEEDRTEHVAALKARGKGAPKKAKSAAGELIMSDLGRAGWLRHWTVRLIFVLQMARNIRRGDRVLERMRLRVVQILHSGDALA